MTRFRLFFLITFLLIPAGRNSYAEDVLRVEYLPKAVKQGGVCFIRGSGPASITSIYGEFRGTRFPLAMGAQNRTYEGLLGIDLNTEPAIYKLKLVAEGGNRRVYTSALLLKVEKVNFKTQTLSLPSSMVDLDPQTLERVDREEKRLKALFRGYRDERLWSGAFVRPVSGELTTAFGLRRVINGQPKSPHTGVDLKAEEGTPVLACNSGVVALVDQLFFSGKSVVLDHGWGTYSMYFHLSETLVNEAEKVRTGVILGRVGSTGRSSGPHLHWGIRISGARVDPLALLRLTEHLRE
ncbi:MAG: M23 family metallopeptidase [Deltaproteobacteria bacterium]|nr:M23 family metallopeptidase [Deltaproteobacteria bacterium]